MLSVGIDVRLVPIADINRHPESGRQFFENAAFSGSQPTALTFGSARILR